jgi:hypothetical protein
MSKNKKSLQEKLAIRRSKTILGHSHTPAIAKGTYAVGTSVRYHQQYNKGPAKWLRSGGGGWIIGGDLIEGYVVPQHEEPENRRREAVMATRKKHGNK